jgi:hypothetical protein
MGPPHPSGEQDQAGRGGIWGAKGHDGSGVAPTAPFPDSLGSGPDRIGMAQNRPPHSRAAQQAGALAVAFSRVLAGQLSPPLSFFYRKEPWTLF